MPPPLLLPSSLLVCIIICKQPAAKRLRFLRLRRPQGALEQERRGGEVRRARQTTLATVPFRHFSSVICARARSFLSRPPYNQAARARPSPLNNPFRSGVKGGNNDGVHAWLHRVALVTSAEMRQKPKRGARRTDGRTARVPLFRSQSCLKVEREMRSGRGRFFSPY